MKFISLLFLLLPSLINATSVIAKLHKFNIGEASKYNIDVEITENSTNCRYYLGIKVSFPSKTKKGEVISALLISEKNGRVLYVNQHDLKSTVTFCEAFDNKSKIENYRLVLGYGFKNNGLILENYELSFK
jgi:hypothetical protein